MLDIAVYNEWTHAAEMILMAGGRVDSCLTWTSIYLDDWSLYNAADMVLSKVICNARLAWKLLRRLVFKLGKICIFTRDLYLQLFVPGGSATKRARIAFDINKHC